MSQYAQYNQPQAEPDDQQYDQNDEPPLSPFEEIEVRDGVRLSWGVWPNSRREATKFVVPLAAVYCPLKNRDQEWYAEGGFVLNKNPIQCQNPRCRANLSCFSKVEHGSSWYCFCERQNSLPQTFNVLESQRSGELCQEATTVEYLSQGQPVGPPIFVYCIDTAVDDDELQSMKEAIILSLSEIPEDAIVGLISFGQNVCVHELGQHSMPRTVVLGGGGNEDGSPKENPMDVRKIKDLLGIRSNDIHAEGSAVWRYCCQAGQGQQFLVDTISDISVDPWPRKQQQRAARATGMASLVGISLLSAFQGYSGRLILFCGGAANVGPGRILTRNLSEQVRSAKDIEQGRCPYYEDAVMFYKGVAQTAASQGHVIDIFVGYLDQTGLAEQRYMCERTGGIMVLSDTFNTDIFKESFLSMFRDKDAFGNMSMCFNAEMEVITSSNIRVSGCIGPVYKMEMENGSQRSWNVAEKEVGIGGTCKWSLGGLDPNTNLTFFFEVAETDNPIPDSSLAYIQFRTIYRTSSGSEITRVTTVEVVFRDPLSKGRQSNGHNAITSMFDQDAAAVIMTKLAVYMKDTEIGRDVIRWIDQSLIRLMKRVAKYDRGRIETFRLDPHISHFHRYMFWLRRSQFLDCFGYSMDEAAFHRVLMMKEKVSNCVTMIEPSLFMYSLNNTVGDAPENVDLDETSLQDDCVLLLDSFFNLVVWFGKSAIAWHRNEEFAQNPEYKWLFLRMEAPLEEQSIRATERYPHPVTIVTHEGESQERFLLAKINPSEDGNNPEKRVLTDDVSLRNFEDCLKKLTVDEN